MRTETYNKLKNAITVELTSIASAVYLRRVIEECLKADPPEGDEIGRWQKAIYDLLRAHVPHPDSIDGGGCDSGDPLDFTLSEISQALEQLKEARSEGN